MNMEKDILKNNEEKHNNSVVKPSIVKIDNELLKSSIIMSSCHCIN
ncbi:hypothetical protein [Floricoccus penangensis]|nr:hypothetical protein [Floricoccus penangensis]